MAVLVTRLARLALALELLHAPVPSSGHLRVRQEGHEKNSNFFAILVKDFQAAPKDRPGFEKTCSELVGKLLPKLREEYTERQVPAVLQSSCEDYKTKLDFARVNYSDAGSGSALKRARTKCMYFGATLATEYSGQTNYPGWCGTVWQYLSSELLSPNVKAKRQAEISDLKRQLDGLKLEKEQLNQPKNETAIPAANASLKEELQYWGPYKGKGGKGGGSDDIPPVHDDSLDPQDALEKKEELLCCSDNCTICEGFQLVDKVVRKSKLPDPCPNSSDPVAVSTLYSERKVKQDDDGEDEGEAEVKKDEAEAEEKDDDEGESDDEEDEGEGESDDEGEEDGESEEEGSEEEDEEEEEGSENDEEGSFLQLQKRRRGVHRGKRRLGLSHAGKTMKVKKKKKKRSDIFHFLVGEFERYQQQSRGKHSLFPSYMPAEEFVEKCDKVIAHLMPKLQEEYTWSQVPTVIVHNCDVYSSMEDFQTQHMNKFMAKDSCRFFAGLLADEFKHQKNYRSWCGEVYSMLLRASDAKAEDLTADQRKMLDMHPDLGKKEPLPALGPQCCAANCRMCEGE